jgi:hypothetical protein
MAHRNIGITLLGVFVAIGAFVAGTIWAQSLHDKVDALDHAIAAWGGAYKAVSDTEIDLNANAATDFAGIKQRLQHRLEHIKQLDDASIKLMNTNVADGKLIDASLALTRRYGDIEQELPKVNSAERLAVLDKDAAAIVDKLEAGGVLMNSEAQKLEETSETQESRVRFAGYALSILGIIVAAIAQLSGKS